MSKELEIKIPELIPVTELKDSAEYPISQEGTTYKVKQSQIESKILTKMDTRFIPSDQKGVANGVAALGSDKKISNENLNINASGGVTGFEPIGKVEQGDKRAVSGEEVFSYIEDDKDILRVKNLEISGENIFNKNYIYGGLINSNVGIIEKNNNGWQVTAIDVVENSTDLYFKNWDTNRVEYSFFSTKIPLIPTDLLKLNGSFLLTGKAIKSNGIAKINIPEKAKSVVIQAKRDSESIEVYSNLIISSSDIISDEKFISKILDTSLAAKYVIDKDGNAHAYEDILTDKKTLPLSFKRLGTDDVFIENKSRNEIREYRFFRDINFKSSNVFDWKRIKIKGSVIRETTDDAAPFRIIGSTVGANHGSNSYSEVDNVGKTELDIGSVWISAGNKYVLFDVTEVSVFFIGESVTGYPTTSLVHVSGGHNTDDIGITSLKTGQAHPTIKSYKRSIIVDGKIKDIDKNSDFNFSNMKYSESYEIVSRSNIIQNILNKKGIKDGYKYISTSSDVLVNTLYEITPDYDITQQKIISKKDSIAVQDIMFVMSNPFSGNYLTYVPTAIPFVENGNSFDLARKQDISSISIPNRLNITDSRVNPVSKFKGDRVVMIKGDYFFATGYLPEYSTSIGKRTENASRKLIQLSASKKIYMSAIDSESINVMNKGDYFENINYKAYGIISDNCMCYRVGRYFFIDTWNVNQLNIISVDASLIGKRFKVIDSINTNIEDGFLTDKIVFFSGERSNCYLILELLD